MDTVNCIKLQVELSNSNKVFNDTDSISKNDDIATLNTRVSDAEN